MSFFQEVQNQNFQKQNSTDVFPRTPVMQSRVQPVILFSTRRPAQTTPSSSSGFRNRELNSFIDVVKVSNPYEYFFYLKNKQEYSKKQKDLILPLQKQQNSMENIGKLTYSIKQIGISSNNDGKFGIQSQRRFLKTSEFKGLSLYSSEKKFEVANGTTNKVLYQFKSRRLPRGRKDNQKRTENTIFFKEPIILPKEQTVKKNKKFHHMQSLKIKGIDGSKGQYNPKEEYIDNFKGTNLGSFSRMLQNLQSKSEIDPTQIVLTADERVIQVSQKSYIRTPKSAGISRGSDRGLLQIYSKIEGQYTL